MNFYPFHLGDYVKKTAHLTPTEDLIYRRLIDRYYMTEQPLPLDVEGVARLIGMRDQTAFVYDILSEFFLKTEEGYRHERCDEEIEKYHKKADSARKANQLRWSFTEEESEADLKSDADQILTKNQEPRTRTNKKKRVEVSPDFLAFWAAYPRKVGRGLAENAWANADLPDIEVILAAIRKARNSADWQKEKGAFIPHPTTWLNQRRWMDEGMDYAALAGKRAPDPSTAREKAIQINEQDAYAWASDRYDVRDGTTFAEWPEPIQREYLKHKQNETQA
jgi:uncharacterized protein YdaU (DUF1376 family)